ncbi:MAG TPA: ATP-binding protein, partial [Trebonia sp.]|nr:ATP-binding protein [Trebonia sp.]
LVPKPDYIFDRVSEWQTLSEFATDERPGATLGVVSGRRRQGKTLLLESMCEELGGLYFTVPEDMPTAEHLRRLAEAIASHTDSLPPRLDSWDDAVDALFALGTDRPTLVVLDEFPYMARSTEGLPSILQHALSPRGKARTESRTRLILCGSSITFMSQLVSGSAALFGRARLSMMVQAFDFRMAAKFWGVDYDRRLAASLFAMAGGTPAYIEYASGTPQSLGELDGWVTRNLLNSNNMLFRQPRMLLSEDSTFSHIGMYGTVLTAIAEGCHTVSTVASRVGRSAADVNHYVKGLLDGGFLWHCEDAFKDKRAEYQIVDPLIRFHHAIVYPNWARLELYRPERAERLWADSQQTFNSQVMGPAFEQMCRAWTEDFADPDQTLGGVPAMVAQTVLNNQAGRSQLQLDIVVKDARREVLAIGEVKSGETIATRHLTRLREAAELLRTHHKIPGDAQPRLLLFSASGFTSELELEASASDGQIQLIGLDRLYDGS